MCVNGVVIGMVIILLQQSPTRRDLRLDPIASIVGVAGTTMLLTAAARVAAARRRVRATSSACASLLSNFLFNNNATNCRSSNRNNNTPTNTNNNLGLRLASLLSLPVQKRKNRKLSCPFFM